jgi:pimeloyl-ACP methyl ester carboxylesterase
VQRLRLGSLVAACALSACTNRLFLHPSHQPIPTDADVRSIPCDTRPIRGRELDAFLLRLGGRECKPAAVVLAFHGNGSRAEVELAALARVFAPWARECGAGGGIELVAVTYPGFGRDREHATLRGLGAGALEAYDWVRAHADGAPVVLYGFSMGSAAALHVVRERSSTPPAAVVLDRPPNIPRIVAGRFGWWNLFLVAGPVLASLPRAVHSVANARHAGRVPALFVIGRRDRLVRPKNAETIVRAYAGPKLTVVFDGGHDAWLDGEAPGLREGIAWVWRVANVAR